MINVEARVHIIVTHCHIYGKHTNKLIKKSVSKVYSADSMSHSRNGSNVRQGETVLLEITGVRNKELSPVRWLVSWRIAGRRGGRS